MTREKAGRQRQRGAIDELPSGALRVRGYGGTDPVSGKRNTLVEIVEPGPKQDARAEAARTRLLNEVDEQRNPRTSATLVQLLALDDWVRHYNTERAHSALKPGYAGRQ